MLNDIDNELRVTQNNKIHTRAHKTVGRRRMVGVPEPRIAGDAKSAGRQSHCCKIVNRKTAVASMDF